MNNIVHRALIILILVCMSAGFGISAAWCQGTGAGVDENANPQASLDQPAVGQFKPGVTPDSVKFYTFLEPTNVVPPGFVGSAVREHPELRRFVGGPRPMVQWYFWANQRKPFLPSVGFILFFSLISWSLLPTLHRRASQVCREKFWSTFLTGVLAVFALILLVRMAIGSLIGWSMGIVLIGLFQLLLMCGVAIVSSIIGQRICSLLKLDKLPLLKERPRSMRFTELLVGALVLSALLQIPGIGVLPRIGTRLVAMLAVLGLGGIFQTRLARSAPSITD